MNQLLQIETPSCRPFCFGKIGNVIYSTRQVKLPAKIGQTKFYIDVEVVQVDIPLLSKASLKKAGTVLDM